MLDMLIVPPGTSGDNRELSRMPEKVAVFAMAPNSFPPVAPRELKLA